MAVGKRLRKLDNGVFGEPTYKPSRLEPYWERPWGWLLPGGAPWKIGRRDGLTGGRSALVTFLVWGVWGVKTYQRGCDRSVAEQRSADK